VCDISPAAGASGISLDEEPPEEEPRARRRVKPLGVAISERVGSVW
jgi:hypothetical protein